MFYCGREYIYIHLEKICKRLLKHVTAEITVSVLTNKAQNIESISTLLATMFTKDRYEVKALSESHVLFLNSVYIAENRTDITGFGYAQLLLPEYFANHKKILFLEPDQIVKGDLTPLWKQVILNDIKIGAVEYTQGKIH